MDNKSNVSNVNSKSSKEKFNKRQILNSFIKLQEEKIDSLKKSINQAKEDIFSSKERGDFHDDPKKETYASLMSGLEAGLAKYEKILCNLKTIVFFEGKTISFGSLIKLQNIDSGDINQYFLICVGGDAVDIDNSKIFSISIKAPLAQALFHKKENEEFRFMEQRFKILSVQ